MGPLASTIPHFFAIKDIIIAYTNRLTFMRKDVYIVLCIHKNVYLCHANTWCGKSENMK